MTKDKPKPPLPTPRPTPPNPHFDPVLDALWERQAAERRAMREARLAEIAERAAPVKATPRKSRPRGAPRAILPVPDVSYEEIVEASDRAARSLEARMHPNDQRRGFYSKLATRIASGPPESSAWKTEYPWMYGVLVKGLLTERRPLFGTRLWQTGEPFHKALGKRLAERHTGLGLHVMLVDVFVVLENYEKGTPERQVLDDLVEHLGPGLVLSIAMGWTDKYSDLLPALDRYREIRDAIEMSLKP